MYNKEYYEEHKDNFRNYHRKYVDNNKEKVYRLIECEICKKLICKNFMSVHRKSKRHMKKENELHED